VEGEKVSMTKVKDGRHLSSLEKTKLRTEAGKRVAKRKKRAEEGNKESYYFPYIESERKADRGSEQMIHKREA